MKLFIESAVCRNRSACKHCRDPLRADMRSEWAKAFVPPENWECPFGAKWGDEQGPTPEASRGLGDSISKMITALTGVKPCGGCRKRRDALNQLVPYQRRVTTSNPREDGGG